MKLMRSVTNGSIVEETITATLDSNSPSIHSNKIVIDILTNEIACLTESEVVEIYATSIW